MGRSAGAGSPAWFRCAVARDTTRRDDRSEHLVTLTGREKPYEAKRRHTLGVRSTYISREYRCECGHVGWSAHVDLARLAGDSRERELVRPA